MFDSDLAHDQGCNRICVQKKEILKIFEQLVRLSDTFAILGGIFNGRFWNLGLICTAYNLKLRITNVCTDATYM